MENIRLDCNACRTLQSMEATKIGKFSSIVRTIGVILLVPSFLGMGVALLMFISMIISSANVGTPKNDAEAAGQAIGLGVVFIFVIITGVVSLVGGLLGWLLLLNRKVYKCLRCGFILDRA
jgi:hypothetical protein